MSHIAVSELFVTASVRGRCQCLTHVSVFHVSQSACHETGPPTEGGVDMDHTAPRRGAVQLQGEEGRRTATCRGAVQFTIQG